MIKRTKAITTVLSVFVCVSPLLTGCSSLHSSVFYYNRGFEKADAGDYSGAMSDYSKAIKINPKNAEAYYNRALIKDAQFNDTFGAISDYSKSIKINPKDSDAYFNRAMLNQLMGDIKSACYDFRKAYGLGEKDAAIWANSCPKY